MRLSHLEVAAVCTALVLTACATGIGLGGDGGGGQGAADTTTSSGSGAYGAGQTTTSTGHGGGGHAGSASSSSGSSSSGSGGGGSSSSSSGSSSSSSGGSCLHGVCDAGPKLTTGCGDPCVDTVCIQDSYCCDTEWDSMCVDEADSFCGAGCGGQGGGGGGSVAPGDLVISEIMNNPSAVPDSYGEWFELYNDSLGTIDLQGLVIHHQANDPTAVHTISQSVLVPPGGYAVLGINADAGTNGNVPIDYQYPSNINLSNTADYLAIESANQVVIDECSYDQQSGLDPNGKTRNLDPYYLSAYDNDTDLNFCEASSPISGGTDLGTPGAANDLCN